MAMMNTAIPFQGYTPNFVNALASGQQAAAQRNELSRMNALANVYQTQGPGILAGETGALNALAGLGEVGQAMGVMDTRQGMDARALQMDATRLGMDATRQDMEMQSRQWAMTLDEQERQARMQEGEQMLTQFIAASDPQSWSQLMAQLGKPDVGFERRNQMIANMLPPLEALRFVEAQSAQPQTEEPAAIAGLRIRAQEAGLQPGTQEYQAFMLNGGAPPASSGMVIESTPGGGFTFRQGEGVGQTERMSPSDPSLMIQNIDGILNDPALPYATGADAWRANIPGTEARRVGARMDQLQGQAFLQAFESLKGAGQITEIEGIKATQAIGRLDRYQRQEDYVEALQELRGILEQAAQRPPGWADTPEGRAAAQALQGQQVAPAAAPVGQSQFVPSVAPAAPVGAPPVAVNANGPMVTGQITADVIRTMTPMQYAEWAAVNAGSFSQLPDDVLQAIIDRGE